MSDNIHVAIRVRPLIAREKNNRSEIYWKVENKNTISQVDNTGKLVPNCSYTFDRVFNVNDSNFCIYEEICLPIVNSVMEGINGTIFAYGQTSSGKTYTMVGTGDNPGIIFFTINSIFDTIENMPDREFLLRISYMEIYNEAISDLLSENTNQNLRIYENLDGQLCVQELKEVTVTNYDQICQIWRQGEKNRHIDATCMNDKSSRSHTIFRMIIESRRRGDNLDDAVKVSHLNLVDLAGSERSGQTGATGERFKEGVHINKSLLMLGNIISRLSEGGEGQFVNFRDSKLTRILRNSLGGNTRTAIICTVTPASLQQTQSTLLFANRAKCIKNDPVVNEILTDAAMLKRCKKQIKQLNDELQKIKDSSQSEKVSAMEKELKEKDKQLFELEQTIKSLTENVVVSKQVPENQQRKPRRETWCAPMHFNQLSLSFSSDLPVTKEEPLILPTFPRQNNSLPNNDSVINFKEISPVLFEADLQVTEKQKLNKEFDLERRNRRMVMFKLPLIDEETQTDPIYQEGKSIAEIFEDYKMITDDYERIKTDYLELKEFTTLEKQILSEDNIGENNLVQILYQRIKSQEAQMGEIQKLLTKEYFKSRERRSIIPNYSFSKEKVMEEICEEKQLIDEFNQLKYNLQTNEETIRNLQKDNEKIFELEQQLKQKSVREKELTTQLDEMYKELNHSKNTLQLMTENFNEQMKEKKNEIKVLSNQILELSNDDKCLKLEEDNKNYKKQIHSLLESIRECDFEKKQLKEELATFNEPLKKLTAEILAILDKNSKLEKIVSDLEQRNQEIEKRLNTLNTELLCQQELRDKLSENQNLEFLYLNIVEEWQQEILFLREAELETHYWYQIQIVIQKHRTEKAKINPTEAVSTVKFEENKELLSSLKENISLYKTEIGNLKEKILSYRNQVEECKLIIEEYRKKYMEMLESESAINSRYERNFRNIFDLQMEIAQEKYKQENVKYELLQEIYNINDNYQKSEEYVKKQLAQLEEMLSDEEARNMGARSLQMEVSSLLDDVKHKEEEIERYKLLLSKKDDEKNLLSMKLETVSKELEDLRFVPNIERLDSIIQCSILDAKTFSGMSSQLEKYAYEKREIEAELIQAEMANKNLSSTVELQEKKITDYELKVNSLEAELDKLNNLSERLKNKLPPQNMGSQTEEEVPSNDTNAVMEARRELCKQKMLNLEMKNQLSNVKKDYESSKEENKYLNEKVQQLKMEVRRLQQPADFSIVCPPKLREVKEEDIQFFEGSGSGIINNLKISWMENRLHNLETEYKKVKMENTRLKNDMKENNVECDVKESKSENVLKSDQVKPLQHSPLQNISGSRLPAKKVINSVSKTTDRVCPPVIDSAPAEQEEECKIQ
ncbi:kinesin-like protein KIN-7N [Centruroides sculpturatus]|uniref:kinesin-like protein KIN-7N n=1 Tax=Centruroides sculpturatus TaxID=218467 RepID=UPI000C6D382B|nr:kinesin-like protein KIN-7N [Centruroides sculpturatus]